MTSVDPKACADLVALIESTDSGAVSTSMRHTTTESYVLIKTMPNASNSTLVANLAAFVKDDCPEMTMTYGPVKLTYRYEVVVSAESRVTLRMRAFDDTEALIADMLLTACEEGGNSRVARILNSERLSTSDFEAKDIVLDQLCE